MDEQGPQWGNQQSQLPPEIERVVKKFKNNPPTFGPVLLILVVLLVAFVAYSSYYQIKPNETGVILRFGKFQGLAGEGPHFKLPLGIDRVVKVPTGTNFKEEFGFRTLRAGVRTSYSPQGFDDESLTLTGDLNVIDLEWIVQFRISDPFKFLFRIRDRQETIRDIAESSVRQVVGNNNVDEVLTTERDRLAGEVQQVMQDVLTKDYDIGVRIVTVKFQDVNPPEPVKPAFNEVNEAEQQRESLILQAREQYNKLVPRAAGEAKQTIQNAEGYAIERINQAEGETARFKALLTEYRKAPEVTRKRLYIETLEDVLPQVKEVFIMDEKTGGALPLLNLRGQKGGAQ